MPYRCSPESLYTSYVQVRYSLHAHAFIRQPDERASARKQIAQILPSFWLPIAAFSRISMSVPEHLAPQHADSNVETMHSMSTPARRAACTAPRSPALSAPQELHQRRAYHEKRTNPPPSAPGATARRPPPTPAPSAASFRSRQYRAPPPAPPSGVPLGGAVSGALEVALGSALALAFGFSCQVPKAAERADAAPASARVSRISRGRTGAPSAAESSALAIESCKAEIESALQAAALPASRRNFERMSQSCVQERQHRAAPAPSAPTMTPWRIAPLLQGPPHLPKHTSAQSSSEAGKAWDSFRRRHSDASDSAHALLTPPSARSSRAVAAKLLSANSAHADRFIGSVWIVRRERIYYDGRKAREKADDDGMARRQLKRLFDPYDSIWTPRAKWCDSKDLYDTRPLLQERFELDWTSALASSASSAISRYGDVGEGRTAASVATQMASDVTFANHDLVHMCFSFFASAEVKAEHG